MCLSFRISDMREHVLLSNITFEGVRVCFERSVFCPSLCFDARLIELLNRVGCRLGWREKFWSL